MYTCRLYSCELWKLRSYISFETHACDKLISCQVCLEEIYSSLIPGYIWCVSHPIFSTFCIWRPLLLICSLIFGGLCDSSGWHADAVWWPRSLSPNRFQLLSVKVKLMLAFCLATQVCEQEVYCCRFLLGSSHHNASHCPVSELYVCSIWKAKSQLNNLQTKL